MMYVDNLRVVYRGSVELHKVHTNIDTPKIGVDGCLDKDEVKCCDEDMVACLDEGVLAFLDKNNKDDFDVYFIHEHPLEYLLERTLGGQCLVHHGYMQKISWCETYDHFCYNHNYKNQMIYHYKMNDGR